MYLAGSMLVATTMAMLSLLMANSMMGKAGLDTQLLDKLSWAFFVVMGISYTWLFIEVEVDILVRLWEHLF